MSADAKVTERHARKQITKRFCCVVFLSRHLFCPLNYHSQTPANEKTCLDYMCVIGSGWLPFNTIETTFLGAFSCPRLSDSYSNREGELPSSLFLTSSFMIFLSLSVSLLIYQTPPVCQSFKCSQDSSQHISAERSLCFLYPPVNSV